MSFNLDKAIACPSKFRKNKLCIAPWIECLRYAFKRAFLKVRHQSDEWIYNGGKGIFGYN